MSTPRLRAGPVLVAALASLGAAAAFGGEIRVACYSDGNECEVTQELAKRFETQNPDVKVVVDKVPYKAILEHCPCNLPQAKGPTSPASPTSVACPATTSTSRRT